MRATQLGKLLLEFAQQVDRDLRRSGCRRNDGGEKPVLLPCAGNSTEAKLRGLPRCTLRVCVYLCRVNGYWLVEEGWGWGMVGGWRRGEGLGWGGGGE